MKAMVLLLFAGLAAIGVTLHQAWVCPCGSNCRETP